MPQTLEFRISSNLKNIIGKELITDDFIAIFELVKNSFDANSTVVDLIFTNLVKDVKNAQIVVRDNGSGMSFEDIQSKWLFVGYSVKKELMEEFSSNDFRDKIGTKRFFAGAKGIGRFSCDRLGKELVLYSKQDSESIIHKLTVQWEKFELDSKEEFQTIGVEYQELKEIDISGISFIDDQGTVLVISGLRSSWDRDKLKGLKRHLQRLINPSPVGVIQDFSIFIYAPEFEPEDEQYGQDEDYEKINGIVKNIVFEKLGIQTTRIICTIDSLGEKIVTELYDKDTFIYKLEEKNTFPLYDVKVFLFYLNRNAKFTFTRVMGIQPVRYGSVFLYKNGIKINPYGNEGDDWLGLDRRKTQGTRRYLGNRDVMGRIELYGTQDNFREVSSRDGGVIKTDEFDKLKDFFIEKIVRPLEKYVVEGINWDNIKKDEEGKNPEEIKLDSIKIINQLIGRVKDDEKNVVVNPDLFRIDSLPVVSNPRQIIKNLQDIQHYLSNNEKKEELNEQIRIITNTFQNMLVQQENLEQELKEKEENVIFLKYTADEDKKEILGLQHHIGITTSTINESLMLLKEEVEQGNITKEFILDIIDDIIYQTKIISSIVLYATKANFDVIPETLNQDLILFIKQYVENVYSQYYRSKLETSNISVEVISNNDDKYKCTFKPLEIIIIIDNMISNSIKAQASSMKIILKKENKKLEIKFKDDGIGIDISNFINIFKFGYSTTNGAGIGLYHIKKIIEKNNWNILVNASMDKGAEFILEVG